MFVLDSLANLVTLDGLLVLSRRVHNQTIYYKQTSESVGEQLQN